MTASPVTALNTPISSRMAYLSSARLVRTLTTACTTADTRISVSATPIAGIMTAEPPKENPPPDDGGSSLYAALIYFGLAYFGLRKR